MAGMTKTMMTTRRMLMILVLSQWQRRGGGKEHRGVRAQIRVTGPGGFCKNLPIANWSPESRVPGLRILAFWLRTPTMSNTTIVLSKGAKVYIISLKRWRKRKLEAEVRSVVHIFTSSAEIISTE